jgi:flagellar operon protein
MADTLINGVKVPFLPVGGVDGLKERPSVNLPAERSFEEILKKEFQELKLSKHAQERLDARNIQLNESDMSSLKNAVSLAEKKGGQDSLVLLRDMAFIVSVKNRTIVTAMDSESMRNNVFTNIDSAVVAA